MNTPELKRLMALARKTGAPLIVTDPEGKEPLVLLGIDIYEAMLGDSCECWEEDISNEEVPLEEIVEDFPEMINEPVGNIEGDDGRSGKSYEEEKKPEITENSLTEEQFYLEPIEPS
ncbi:MAG: hypothetical protein WC730_02665 [Patescibacteria group bacterium]|jgi:hypothetical protein